MLAIPRGGVAVGHGVADALGAEMYPVIACKLGLPHQPEAAFGAVAEDGSRYLADDAEDILSPEVVDRLALDVQKEIDRRVQLYRKGAPIPSLERRTIIIVDDGIATGATVKAVIAMCRRQNVGRIIVAAPIAGQDSVAELGRLADEVTVIDTPSHYLAVSQGYVEFENLKDAQVLEILRHYAAKR